MAWPALVGGERAWPGFKPMREPNSDQAPQVWRAPEGPRARAGFEGAVNEVRP